MRRALLGTMACIALACGGGESTPDEITGPTEPADLQENRPPYVEAIAISPEEPSAEDALSLGLRVIDPDRDRLSMEVVWYRNGSVYDDSNRESIDPGEFQRGDSVWAQVEISDGIERVEAATDPVTIRNAPPRVDAIRFKPAQPTAADVVDAEIEGADADGDAVEWSYRWLVDGRPLANASATRLPAGVIKRGSRLAIEVSGNDGNEVGEWTSSAEITVANAAPRILTQPVYGLASPGRYLYEIKAKDSDGDEPLRFELLDGPAGMDVDSASGALTWLLPSDAKGSFPVEIAVSDPNGARSVQRWSLDIRWEEGSDAQPAAPQPAQQETPETQEPAPQPESADEADEESAASDDGEADADEGDAGSPASEDEASVEGDVEDEGDALESGDF